MKLRRYKNGHLKQLCQELEDHSECNNSKELFRCVKILISKTTTARLAIILKYDTGKMLTENSDIQNCWKVYCEVFYASQETN